MTKHKKQHLPPTNPRTKPHEPNAQPSASSTGSHMTRNDSKRSSTASVQQKLLFSTIPTANNPDPPQATVAAVTPGNNLQHTQEEAPNDTNTESPANAPAILRTSLRYRVILDVKPDTTSKKTLLEVFSE